MENFNIVLVFVSFFIGGGIGALVFSHLFTLNEAKESTKQVSHDNEVLLCPNCNSSSNILKEVIFSIKDSDVASSDHGMFVEADLDNSLYVRTVGLSDDSYIQENYIEEPYNHFVIQHYRCLECHSYHQVVHSRVSNDTVVMVDKKVI